MIADNPYHRDPPFGPNALPLAKQLAERLSHYFDRHPEVSREEFFLEAVRREIHFCEQREARRKSIALRRSGEVTDDERPAAGRMRSAEEIRIQAALAQRLAVFHYERHGIWPRVRRFFNWL